MQWQWQAARPKIVLIHVFLPGRQQAASTLLSMCSQPTAVPLDVEPTGGKLVGRCNTARRTGAHCLCKTPSVAQCRSLPRQFPATHCRWVLYQWQVRRWEVVQRPNVGLIRQGLKVWLIGAFLIGHIIPQVGSCNLQPHRPTEGCKVRRVSSLVQETMCHTALTRRQAGKQAGCG